MLAIRQERGSSRWKLALESLHLAAPGPALRKKRKLEIQFTCQNVSVVRFFEAIKMFDFNVRSNCMWTANEIGLLVA